MFGSMLWVFVFFFFQAEDGIRDAQESRGLGDVYKRQRYGWTCGGRRDRIRNNIAGARAGSAAGSRDDLSLSLIHI